MKLKLLWYCTKNKPYLFDCYQGTLERCAYVTSYSKSFKDKDYVLNGKIVAESDYEVEEVKEIYCCGCLIQTKTMCHQELLGRSRLTDEEFDKYNPNYAIHIKNLNIFDKPKELSEFYSHDDSYDNMFGWAFEDRPKYIPLKKAHRNMMYVYDKDGTRYILISSHPDCMAQILNGLRTIDPRKRVLKEML